MVRPVAQLMTAARMHTVAWDTDAVAQLPRITNTADVTRQFGTLAPARPAIGARGLEVEADQRHLPRGLFIDDAPHAHRRRPTTARPAS